MPATTASPSVWPSQDKAPPSSGPLLQLLWSQVPGIVRGAVPWARPRRPVGPRWAWPPFQLPPGTRSGPLMCGTRALPAPSGRRRARPPLEKPPLLRGPPSFRRRGASREQDRPSSWRCPPRVSRGGGGWPEKPRGPKTFGPPGHVEHGDRCAVGRARFRGSRRRVFPRYRAPRLGHHPGWGTTARPAPAKYRRGEPACAPAKPSTFPATGF